MSFTPFGTMSDLRSYSDLTITTFNVVEDGRSGLFDYDSADTATTDDGAMIVIQGSSRRFKRRYEGHVLPQWFGAIGNGVADDTIPIQAAINSGISVIYFPSGKYLTTSKINISWSGTSMTFIGNGSTQLVETGSVILIPSDGGGNI